VPHTETCDPRLYYEVHGQGDPLVLVMGLGIDSVGWLPQLKAFSASYRTVVFDNRDVGRSDYVDASYSLGDMAGDVLRLCDELSLGSFHLVGLSMGGMIAQHLALAAPERVRTLTLCVTMGGAGRYGAERARILGEMAARGSFEDHVDTLMTLTMSEGFYERPEQVDYLRRMMVDHPHPQRPEGFRRQAEAVGGHDVRDRLAELSMPVQVIGAERDVLVPVWKSEELAELIPGARLEVVDAAPHGVNLEHADEFNRTVLGFLAGAGR
jgi:3-oxoadipate enol-lactonase